MMKRPVRPRLARTLVKLAAKVDGRPDVTFSISHHHPEGWVAAPPTGTRLTGIIRKVPKFEGSLLGDILDKADRDVQVAPLLGVKFIKPWKFKRP